MKTLKYLFFSILILLGCQPAEPPAPQWSFAPDDDGLVLPESFEAVVVADSLGRGRHLTVRNNGDIYVHLANRTESDHSIIALRDTSEDGRADIHESFAPYPGTGIRIHKNHIYFATKATIHRTPLVDGQLLPSGTLDTIVHLEGGEGGHSEKTFAFDQAGGLYVNVGSLSNACQEEMRSKGSPGIDPCVELETRAGIWKFADDQTGQVQTFDHRFATGIRNAVAINWDPASSELFVLQHGRDDLHRFWPDLFTEEQNVELPAEEFMLVQEGDDFGWPYCYYDHQKGMRLLNPEYGGDGTRVDRCADAKDPLIGFPGHWGPNDIIFYQGDQFPERYKNGAFIAFHGSWNRLGHPQAGFNVVFVPMTNGQPYGDWEVFADGFIGAESIKSPGEAKYRPCGLAEGPDGTLYIVDSMKGRVWRIIYSPEA